MKAQLKQAIDAGVPLAALKVAAIVGTLLNLINQGEAMFGSATIVWWKIALTYCVPFLVSAHGAVTALAQAPDRPD